MPDDFVELTPDLVINAGRQTAATAGQWSGWASRVGSLLREAAGSARDPVVTAAIEEHLSTVHPWLYRLAANIEALGGNASSAGSVLVDADQDGAARFGRRHATALGAAALLARPVNHPAVGS